MRQPPSRRYTGIVIGLFVAAIGVVGVLFAASRIQCSGSSCASGGNKSIVVAARSIDAGAAITVDDLQIQGVTAGAAPADAFTSTDAAIGGYAAVGISANTPMTPSLVRRGGAVPQPIPPFKLQPGDVAVAIPAQTALVTVGGYIQEGDHIDIIANPTENSGGTAATPIFKNVPVLRVGSIGQKGGTVIADVLVVEIPRDAAIQLSQYTDKNSAGVILQYYLLPPPPLPTAGA